jgi:Raf kinase inhibitor-like YbhB/YbcL family protein
LSKNANNLILESSAFKDGQEIPKKYGYKNGNASPPLTIRGMPDGAKSLALIMDDPDAMGAVGKLWVHWVVWNIDAGTKEIAESSLPQGAIEGTTDFGQVGYGGPAPPDKRHTYIFKLYALNAKLTLQKGATKKQLEDAMQNHIIAQTSLCGTYAPS